MSVVIICNVKNLRLYTLVPSCNDLVMNGNETDVDCGGPCLPTQTCGDQLRCNNASDCTSGVCEFNICQGEYVIICNAKYLIVSRVVPTCNDLVKNANETDVDCGGWCAPQKKCANTMGCHNSYDCISGVCTLNICRSEYSYWSHEVFEVLYCRSQLL